MCDCRLKRSLPRKERYFFLTLYYQFNNPEGEQTVRCRLPLFCACAKVCVELKLNAETKLRGKEDMTKHCVGEPGSASLVMV